MKVKCYVILMCVFFFKVDYRESNLLLVACFNHYNSYFKWNTHTHNYFQCVFVLRDGKFASGIKNINFDFYPYTDVCKHCVFLFVQSILNKGNNL